jgi:hypothetical protein
VDVGDAPDCSAWRVLEILPKDEEAVGLGVRQRAEKNTVHDGEDGRIGTDAERKDEQKSGGESRAASEQSERIADIAGQQRHIDAIRHA